MYIDEQSKMNLNSVLQFVSIRAERENASLLLYLHGGPGAAALPLVMKYNKALELAVHGGCMGAARRRKVLLQI